MITSITFIWEELGPCALWNFFFQTLHALQNLLIAIDQLITKLDEATLLNFDKSCNVSASDCRQQSLQLPQSLIIHRNQNHHPLELGIRFDNRSTEKIILNYPDITDDAFVNSERSLRKPIDAVEDRPLTSVRKHMSCCFIKSSKQQKDLRFNTNKEPALRVASISPSLLFCRPDLMLHNPNSHKNCTNGTDSLYPCGPSLPVDFAPSNPAVKAITDDGRNNQNSIFVVPLRQPFLHNFPHFFGGSVAHGADLDAAGSSGYQCGAGRPVMLLVIPALRPADKIIIPVVFVLPFRSAILTAEKRNMDVSRPTKTDSLGGSFLCQTIMPFSVSPPSIDS